MVPGPGLEHVATACHQPGLEEANTAGAPFSWQSKWHLVKRKSPGPTHTHRKEAALQDSSVRAGTMPAKMITDTDRK